MMEDNVMTRTLMTKNVLTDTAMTEHVMTEHAREDDSEISKDYNTISDYIIYMVVFVAAKTQTLTLV